MHTTLTGKYSRGATRKLTSGACGSFFECAAIQEALAAASAAATAPIGHDARSATTRGALSLLGPAVSPISTVPTSGFPRVHCDVASTTVDWSQGT